MHIVIATAGWVFIGERTEKNGRIFLSNASSIRVWGTTHGLGELALKGPTKNTILDKCGILSIPVSAEIATLECKAGVWR